MSDDATTLWRALVSAYERSSIDFKLGDFELHLGPASTVVLLVVELAWLVW